MNSANRMSDSSLAKRNTSIGIPRIFLGKSLLDSFIQFQSHIFDRNAGEIADNFIDKVRTVEIIFFDF